MSSTLFISDLHLEATRTGLTRALAAFLQKHTACKSLYILGDLFDTWVGDDDDAPLAREVTGMLREFSAAGPQLYLMVGNRDFLLGETFCRAAGATLLPDPSLIDLYGCPTLLMHGDSLCTADTGYQALHREVRDPYWQAELLAQPLAERRDVARRLRSMSMEANSGKPGEIMDVTPSEVERVMREHGASQLIHGHTHRPAQHEEPEGRRWVLGEWDRQGWAIEASDRDIRLFNFVLYQQDIIQN